MGNLFAPAHLIILILLCIIFFGKGKLPDLMTDLAKGIKAFKKTLQEEENEQNAPVILNKQEESKKKTTRAATRKKSVTASKGTAPKNKKK